LIVEGFEEATAPTVADTAEAVTDPKAEADTRLGVNTLLSSLATENAVAKQDADLIEQQQGELLDAMIRIYAKINSMKAATKKSITNST
jgi:hypothetical protein